MADATDLQTAIAAELTALYPAIPVLVRKHAPPGGGPLPGWRTDDPNPCFVVSVEDADEIDDAIATFEDVGVGYIATVSHVRVYTPGQQDDDPEMRAVGQAVRRRLYKPRLGSLPNVADVSLAGRGVMDQADKNPLARFTSWAFTFTLTEPRPV